MIQKELCSGLSYLPSQNYLNPPISLFCLVSLNSLQRWEVCLEGSVPASSSHVTSTFAEKFKCTDEPPAVQEVSNPSAKPCVPTAHFSRYSAGMGTSANYSTSSLLQKQQGLGWKPARAAWAARQLQKLLLRGSRRGRSAGGGERMPVRGGGGRTPAWKCICPQEARPSLWSPFLSLRSSFFFLFIFSSPCLFFASFIYSFLISSTSSFSLHPSFLLFFYLFVCLLAFWCSTTRIFCTICYIVIQK